MIINSKSIIEDYFGYFILNLLFINIFIMKNKYKNYAVIEPVIVIKVVPSPVIVDAGTVIVKADEVLGSVRVFVEGSIV